MYGRAEAVFGSITSIASHLSDGRSGEGARGAVGNRTTLLRK